MSCPIALMLPEHLLIDITKFLLTSCHDVAPACLTVQYLSLSYSLTSLVYVCVFVFISRSTLKSDQVKKVDNIENNARGKIVKRLCACLSPLVVLLFYYSNANCLLAAITTVTSSTTYLENWNELRAKRLFPMANTFNSFFFVFPLTWVLHIELWFHSIKNKHRWQRRKYKKKINIDRKKESLNRIVGSNERNFRDNSLRKTRWIGNKSSAFSKFSMRKLSTAWMWQWF